MKMLSLLRRSLIGLCGAVLGLACMVSVSRSDEVSAQMSALGLVVHGAEETLARFCHPEEGTLWFTLPSGVRFELMTSTSELPNPGDGFFHPFDENVVRASLQSVRFPMDRVSAEVFILPYPRRESLPSAAGPELILLSPGVMPLAVEQQHATVVHELGHVIQYQFMPDADADLWSRYRALRGISDGLRFSADAVHADRPHEIFAEDFRVLFGDALANYSGTIENASLRAPYRVPGLESFMTSLEGAPIAGGWLTGFPNPTRGALSFRRAGDPAQTLDLYDVSGRRVASLAPTPLASGWQWRWDGREERGSAATPGVYFARERGARSSFRFVVAQ
jgi:hypothetical protein